MDLVQPRFAVVPSDLESELAGDAFYRREQAPLGKGALSALQKLKVSRKSDPTLNYDSAAIELWKFNPCNPSDRFLACSKTNLRH